VRQVWPAVAGISYARLESAGLQWPCRDEADPGATLLHQQAFARSRTARLECIEYLPTTERCSSDYPFTLMTGRTLYAFNAGTMTARTANQALRPGDVLEISVADAARLNVRHGQRVRIRSRYGEAVLPVEIGQRVKPGELFASFHDPRCGVNRLTSRVRDRRVDAPEYKVTAVRIEPLDG